MNLINLYIIFALLFKPIKGPRAADLAATAPSP